MPNLDLYYRDCVIGGPGALYVIAKDFQAFANAIRRKLILEISDLGMPAGRKRPLLRLVADERDAPNCDAGENEFRGRFYRQP
jgi:hypothetical protein